MRVAYRREGGFFRGAGLAVVLAVLAGSATVLADPKFGPWKPLQGQKDGETGLYGRSYTNENRYRKSGCTTHYEIQNRSAGDTRFCVTFTGQSKSADMFLKPQGKYPWDLDMCQEPGVSIRVAEPKAVLACDTRPPSKTEKSSGGTGGVIEFPGTKRAQATGAEFRSFDISCLGVAAAPGWTRWYELPDNHKNRVWVRFQRELGSKNHLTWQLRNLYAGDIELEFEMRVQGPNGPELVNGPGKLRPSQMSQPKSVACDQIVGGRLSGLSVYEKAGSR